MKPTKTGLYWMKDGAGGWTVVRVNYQSLIGHPIHLVYLSIGDEMPCWVADTEDEEWGEEIRPPDS